MVDKKALPIQDIDGLKYYKIAGKNILNDLIGLLPDAKIICSTLHWSAGNYKQVFKEYQVNVLKDDYILVSSDVDQWIHHQHTWHRNTGNIGVSFMAMFNSKYPITDSMIENAAKVWACIKHKYNLAWDKFQDHAHYSTIDNYEAQFVKVDCRSKVLDNGVEATVFEKTLQKAKWYHQKYFENE